MDEGQAVTWGMLVALLTVLPFTVLTASHANLNAHILPRAFLVALFSSVIPYSLDMLALKRLSKLSFGVLMSMEPAMASLVGLVLLGEELMPIQIIAIALIMLASLGTTFARILPIKAGTNN